MNYLICGAPGSGKTTWVKQNKRWDDYVIDLDYLYSALTLNKDREKPAGTYEIMQELFKIIIEILIKDKDRNIYIIRCSPTKEEREYYKLNYGTKNILIECHSITCQKRRCEGINNLSIREKIIKYVERWFKNYQEGTIDEVIKGY